MSRSAIAIHTTPAAVITHTVATIRGQQLADLSVYHARTRDVRIALTWGEVLMHIWTCQAAQGLLESFSAAQAAMARVPLEIPSPANPCDEPFARTTLAVEWTRRPTYAVVPQSGPSKIGGRTLHWVDLYTGPLTWRIRDHAGLRSTVQLLREAHRTAIAVSRMVTATAPTQPPMTTSGPSESTPRPGLPGPTNPGGRAGSAATDHLASHSGASVHPQRLR
jgi:hypothetical protein